MPTVLGPFVCEASALVTECISQCLLSVAQHQPRSLHWRQWSCTWSRCLPSLRRQLQPCCCRACSSSARGSVQLLYVDRFQVGCLHALFWWTSENQLEYDNSCIKRNVCMKCLRPGFDSQRSPLNAPKLWGGCGKPPPGTERLSIRP